MTQDTKSAWSSPEVPEASRWRRPQTPPTRFLGGTPVNVALRLFVLSLIVGALLMWLDIRPVDIVQGVIHFVQHIWALGFEAIRQIGDYLVVGAMIVVPLWLIVRLLSAR
jgi:hypothetical protein